MFSFRMKYVSRIVAIIVVLNSIANAASKPHVVALGRWTSISIRSEDRENSQRLLKLERYTSTDAPGNSPSAERTM
jgi:hypothetical protein